MPAARETASAAELAAATPQYHPEAYDFVERAVTFTTSKLPRRRHVSARELLDGAREFAELQYGAVFPLVLREWGISTAHDVGFLVYRMIGAGVLSASEDDSPQDFEIEFSFQTAPERSAPELPVVE